MKNFLMTAGTILFSLIIGIIPSACSKRKVTAHVPQYIVVSTEDASYGNVVRRSYRVRVRHEVTTEELTTISNEIVGKATSQRKINAVMIFFYLPGSDTRMAYTAGKAVWAPGGDWGKASTDLPHRLVVETRGAMGSISKKNVVSLPLEKKKEIFLQIVRYQDRGIGARKAYAVVAKKFGITVEQANKIGVEGVVKGWPMP